MKIGILFQDSNFENLDLTNPENGNMGIGGTQFSFLMLAKYLKIHFPEVNVYIYHFSNNKFPQGLHTKLIKETDEFYKHVLEEEIDVIVIRNVLSERESNIISDYQIPTIVWAHNYIFSEELRILTNNNYIKRVVFVGKEQYDRYIDHPIINKSTYIYNMFNSNKKEYNRIENYDLIVCYVGSLVPSKGFHVLAKQWKRIVSKVPNAQLYVIGTGTLYNRNSKLGQYGIAEEKYEKQILKSLSAEGKILKSVKFCGLLGQEKIKIFNNTAVGVINPTGKTETFGISAVEMEACGIPIATIGKNGLLDTVIHKKTGLLNQTPMGLGNNIIKLLKHKELNSKLGEQAQEFVSLSFNPEKVVKEWYELLLDIKMDKKNVYKEPTKNFYNNFKWLRIVNRTIRSNKYFSWVPPLIDIESRIKTMVYK